MWPVCELVVRLFSVRCRLTKRLHSQTVRLFQSVTCDVSSSQLAHAIRLLLEYTDTSYEDKKYSMGDGDYTLLLRPLLP